MNKFVISILLSVSIFLFVVLNPLRTNAQIIICPYATCICDGTCNQDCAIPNTPNCPPDNTPTCAFSKINCPAGTVKSTTVIASECRRKLCNIGTAQTIGNCCEYATRPRVCGDWYDCPTRNNPNKMCRDCEPEETYCLSTRVTTYECTPTCAATAPSNVNYSNNTLTWTTGSGGVSQQLYVSTTQSDVTNNCGTGSNCIVNATGLSAIASSYPFSPTLTPDTIYYVKIATFKDATCAPYTIYGFITPLSNNAWWQVKDGGGLLIPTGVTMVRQHRLCTGGTLSAESPRR